MNKDELLKIYSAHLPYKTPITLASEAYNYDGLTTILSPHYLLDWQRNKCKISLHLWDLSYLTKEIEHEGEKIIPIEKLFGSALAISGYTVYQDFQYKEFAHLTYVKDGLKPFPFLFEHYQKLFEWHFNIYQLPEDQFINKATLTNK